MNESNIAKLKLITAMFLFGTIGLFVRFIHLPSGFIAFARGIIGMLFLLLIIILNKSGIHWKAIRSNLSYLLISGICLGLNWMLLFEAYHYTTVAKATLCYYLAPIFVILISPIVLKEKLTVQKIGYILMALLGMFFVSDVTNMENLKLAEIKGILFGISAAVLYASVIILNKKMKKISTYDMTIVQLFVSAVVMLPYSIFTSNFSNLNISFFEIVILFVIGIVHTGIAYALYFGATKDLKAQTVALIGYLDPAVAILLSAVVLKENLGIIEIIGAVLILGSTMLGEITKHKNV